MTTDRSASTPALVLLASVELLVFLEVSIVNVALSAMVGALALTAVATAWVINGYQLSFGGLQLATGRLVDTVGARRLFQAGLVLFAAASWAAGAATTSEALVAARVVQGVGAALLVPAELALIARIFVTPDQHRRAFAVWSTMAAVGAGAGTALGGLLTEYAGWPWIFWLNIPIALVALPASWLLLPADPPRDARVGGSVNWAGTIACSVLAGALVLASSALLDRDWVMIGWCVGTAVGAGIVLATASGRGRPPVIPGVVVAVPAIRAGVYANALVGATHVPIFVLLAMGLQDVMGMTAWEAGLAVLPTAVVNAIAARTILTPALERVGADAVLMASFFLVGTSSLWFAVTIREGADYLVAVLPGSVVLAVGLPGLFAGATMSALRASPEALAGTVSGVLNTAQRVGAAVGVAVTLELALSRGVVTDLTVPLLLVAALSVVGIVTSRPRTRASGAADTATAGTAPVDAPSATRPSPGGTGPSTDEGLG